MDATKALQNPAAQATPGAELTLGRKTPPDVLPMASQESRYTH